MAEFSFIHMSLRIIIQLRQDIFGDSCSFVCNLSCYETFTLYTAFYTARLLASIVKTAHQVASLVGDVKASQTQSLYSTYCWARTLNSADEKKA